MTAVEHGSEEEQTVSLLAGRGGGGQCFKRRATLPLQRAYLVLLKDFVKFVGRALTPREHGGVSPTRGFTDPVPARCSQCPGEAQKERRRLGPLVQARAVNASGKLRGSWPKASCKVHNLRRACQGLSTRQGSGRRRLVQATRSCAFALGKAGCHCPKTKKGRMT